MYSGAYEFTSLDLAAPGAADDAIAFADAVLGGLDVLINNAAIPHDAMLAHTPPSELERIINFNLVVPLVLARRAVREMIRAGSGGVIINISSVAARRGFSGMTAYAAAKGGVEAFTRSAARELGGHGIHVNCVAGGFFESELSGSLAPSQIASIRRRTPTRVAVSAEQVAGAVAFLVHADQRNMTGQVLVVDGGFST